MAIINEAELKLNIDKLKMYYNEALQNEEVFKNLFVKEDFYDSSNLTKLKEYEKGLFNNIKEINQKHLKNIEYYEYILNKYNLTAMLNAKKFKNMENNYDK